MDKMKLFIICVGNDNEYVSNDRWRTTNNSLLAKKYTSAAAACRAAHQITNKTGQKTMVRELTMVNTQELAEIIHNQMADILGVWAADIDIDYNQNIVRVFDPDGRRTYKITITTQYAD